MPSLDVGMGEDANKTELQEGCFFWREDCLGWVTVAMLRKKSDCGGKVLIDFAVLLKQACFANHGALQAGRLVKDASEAEDLQVHCCA